MNEWLILDQFFDFTVDSPELLYLEDADRDVMRKVEIVAHNFLDRKRHWEEMRILKIWDLVEKDVSMRSNKFPLLSPKEDMPLYLAFKVIKNNKLLNDKNSVETKLEGKRPERKAEVCDNYRERALNEHKKWSDDDQYFLRGMYNNGVSFTNMARRLGRTIHAVTYRLNLLGMIKVNIVSMVSNRVCYHCKKSLFYRAISYCSFKKHLCLDCYSDDSVRIDVMRGIK